MPGRVSDCKTSTSPVTQDPKPNCPTGQYSHPLPDAVVVDMFTDEYISPDDPSYGTLITNRGIAGKWEEVSGSYGCHIAVRSTGGNLSFADMAKGVRDAFVEIMERRGEEELDKSKTYQAAGKVFHVFICAPETITAAELGNLASAARAAKAAKDMKDALNALKTNVYTGVAIVVVESICEHGPEPKLPDDNDATPDPTPTPTATPAPPPTPQQELDALEKQLTDLTASPDCSWGCGVLGVRVRGKAPLVWDDVCCWARIGSTERGISGMQVSSTRDVGVAGGGGQVAAHSGLFALGRFADGLGLGEALSAAVPNAGERAPSHDRGKVLVHLLLVLAGGGEACSDIEHLRAQPVLFGEVASDSTLYRALRGLGPDVVEALVGAVAGVRAGVWERRGDASGSAPVVLDIDSTLVEVHSENKQGAAAHFKGGFGFHPMLCATDAGEPLSIKLRAGNAAANDICDHIEVLDAAIAQLPAAVAGGHREGDGQAPLREVHLRVDAAGCSARIAEACRDRDVGFFMTARSNHQVEGACQFLCVRGVV